MTNMNVLRSRSSRSPEERLRIVADDCGLAGDARRGDERPDPKGGTRTLAELEAVIKRGRATYIAVGEALREIRARRLYKAHYTTFEEYCLETWGFTRSSAYDYMKAATVGHALQNEGKDAPASVRAALAVVEPIRTPREAVSTPTTLPSVPYSVQNNPIGGYVAALERLSQRLPAIVLALPDGQEKEIAMTRIRLALQLLLVL